jgi:hypothetical protein
LFASASAATAKLNLMQMSLATDKAFLSHALTAVLRHLWQVPLEARGQGLNLR